MTDELDIKLNEHYAGKVVRKDLTKLIKEGANVPNYVLEYLLGMYCATDDENDIENGTAMVKQILAENYVRPDEAEKIKAKIRERGQFKIIDKVSARLNEHNDTYEGQIFNLNIARIRITDDYIKMYDKLLGGIWCIINLAYEFDENSKESPFKILSLKPVQMPAIIRDSRRFVIGRGLEEGDAVNTWNAEEVGLTDSHAENGTGISPLQVQTAKGLNRIRKQGAGSRFVHGGSIPQEVMVPVLHVNIKKKQGVSDVSVDILNKKSKITTNTQTISFYQNEPVSEKVKEVTLRFGFYDQAGNLLSDSITLTFGSTSEDSTQREQKHRFMFKRQLSDLNGQEIYLRKEQQVAGSSQFKKLEDIAYKVSVLFMAEF